MARWASDHRRQRRCRERPIRPAPQSTAGVAPESLPGALIDQGLPAVGVGDHTVVQAVDRLDEQRSERSVEYRGEATGGSAPLAGRGLYLASEASGDQ